MVAGVGGVGAAQVKADDEKILGAGIYSASDNFNSYIGKATEKLASDFGLDPDKPPANAIALPPPKRGLTDEQWADIAYCLRVLTDYLDLLHDWRERYKPATPEEPHDPRFEEALHMTETIEHLTDCVAFGTSQQKAAAAARLLSGSYLLMLEERTPGRI